MTSYKGDYTDDLGRRHCAASLVTRLYATDEQPIELDTVETELLPAVFLNNLYPDRRGVCSLVVTPRKVKAYLSKDGTIVFEFPIPFIGGSQEYRNLLDQVEANRLILAYDILPEQISAKWLGAWLR